MATITPRSVWSQILQDGDEEQLAEIGYYQDAPEAVATGIDPIPGVDDGEGPGKGFEIYRIPSVLLAEDPDLWLPWDLFRWGKEAITFEDSLTLSFRDLHLLETMMEAAQRKRTKQMEKNKEHQEEQIQQWKNGSPQKKEQ